MGDMDLNFSINKNIGSLDMFVLDQAVRGKDCRIREWWRRDDNMEEDEEEG